MPGRSTDRAEADPGALRRALANVAEPGRAVAMAAYMKDNFEFLGVPARGRRGAPRDWVVAVAADGPDAALRAAAELWREPEREFQYVGCDLLRRVERRLTPDALPALHDLVTSRSWWDTVDSLAHVVGAVVRRHPDLAASEVEGWIHDTDMWAARVAILHQLGWAADARPEVVVRLCEERIGDGEFFIRKAIGWALRDLARHFPDEVWAWVDAHPELAGLSRREATKHRPS